MPTQLTIEASRPHCRTPLPGRADRPVCGLPLEYHRDTDWWHCPAHGPQITGVGLARRQAVELGRAR